MNTLLKAFDSGFGRGGRHGMRGAHPGLFLLCAVIALLLVAAVVMLWRRRNGSHGSPTLPPPAPTSTSPYSAVTASAEGILSERFARGEISVEEFTARRAALRGEYVPAGSTLTVPQVDVTTADDSASE